MKINHLSKICSFGGLYFVLDQYDNFNLERLLDESLPHLSANSVYSWKDIIYSFASILYCGGHSIEDAKTVLGHQISENPKFNLCSPDTILRRFKELATEDEFCKTPRGSVTHQFNCNSALNKLNIKLLKSLGEFDKDSIVLDYDNTIVFTEKQDCNMTYKKQYGYQPGVCMLNESKILYIENRNGNSDAKSFQNETLTRMFDELKAQGITKIDKFRADAGSHHFDAIQVVENNVNTFYIGAKTAYVSKYFTEVKQWHPAQDQMGDDIFYGYIDIVPFKNRYKMGDSKKTYRLLVKKKKRSDGQLNVFTNEAYDYHSVLTNDFKIEALQGLQFYYRRGAAEKQFDVMKNDFGWNYPAFSKLSQNTVFLYISALINNMNEKVLTELSTIYKSVQTKYRMKRFIFKFISIPAKWVFRSRQWQLNIYGKLQV